MSKQKNTSRSKKSLVALREVNRRRFMGLGAGALAAAAAMTLAEQNATAGKIDIRHFSQPYFGGISEANYGTARQRAAALVAKMTLAEKISQLGNSAPAIKRIGLPSYQYWTECLHGVLTGGPVTSFPQPLAMGNSWNPELIHKVYDAVSDEARAMNRSRGLHLTMYSPATVNMGTRDPRWGRIEENFSEDPLLVGELAGHAIRGMQGTDKKYLKTIACAKHYICNDTDSDRETTSATVDPRSFWEYYTRGFHALVTKYHSFTVMSSYNEVNGVPTTGSRYLLTDILRKRWGFRGYVTSDCDAVGDIYRTHHFVQTWHEAAALALNAGCDLNCGGTLQRHTMKAYQDGLVKQDVIDESLTNILTGRFLLGEFDPPTDNPYSNIPVSCIESTAHQALAREAARQSIVLLKNQDNLLPLNKKAVRHIAVIGPMAAQAHLGGYSGGPHHRISPAAGIAAALGVNLHYNHIPATQFTEKSKSPQPQASSEGFGDLGYITNGDWAAYAAIDFTNKTQLTARVSSQNAGGKIEVHLDQINGPLACTLNVPHTGGWQKWQTVTVALDGITGMHKLYLKFVGGGGDLLNIEWLALLPLSAPSHNTSVVVVESGCSVTGPKDDKAFAAAVAAAKAADVAIVFAGANQQTDREGRDRQHLRFPGVQHELIKAVYEANPRTILVITSNCPIAATWEQDNLPAILTGLFAGEQQGNAIADVLFGDYNPGGKLATTWFTGIEQLPHFHDYDIRKGRTYMYFKGKPLYPFGYGLNYTQFAYKSSKASGSSLATGSTVHVTVTIANPGPKDGDEIVQLYVRFLKSKIVRPIKQLVDFKRLHIKSGMS
ncbi:MAG: carbohydrate-binding protein, partial [Phycisphaerales bacterium]|nr:carbohydrate-binding protein [Phycisphaerales bacterium]